MSGVLMLLESEGSGSGGGGGGGTTLSALHWTNLTSSIFAAFAGSNIQTIAGITVPVSISAGITGGATLEYLLNGSFHAYTGAFNVSAGDTLQWFVITSMGSGTKSGTITVTNATTATVVATMSYSVTG